MFLEVESAVLAIAPRVGAIGLLLLAAGLALAGLTLRFWSAARPETPALAPLEIMSDRRYQRATEQQRLAMVDSVRGLASAAPKLGTSSPSTDSSSARPTRRAPIDPLIK